MLNKFSKYSLFIVGSCQITLIDVRVINISKLMLLIVVITFVEFAQFRIKLFICIRVTLIHTWII